VDAETVHRFHFAFTATFHYLFPQLTMGLALLIVVWKVGALRAGDEGTRALRDAAATFWGKVLAVAFVFGVATGIPLEFQFGTSWARFSEATGGVIFHALAMEGVFAFFLESAFLGLFLHGAGKYSPKAHLAIAVALFVGTWASGYFVICANAWMQHPVDTRRLEDGRLVVGSLWSIVSNPWAFWQYAHTMLGSVVTACFFVAGCGAFYALLGRHDAHARVFLKTGVLVGLPAAALLAFPTGDVQAQYVHDHHPAAFAAMEGHFETRAHAPLVLIGQPDMDRLELDNPVEAPGVLSFLTHRRFAAEVRGLRDFPRDEWPDQVPLLYYAYHVMIGLGTLFLATLALAAWKAVRGTLATSRPVLWLLLLAVPFPFVANTAGWLTTELGRQPWVVHGLMRTSEAHSENVSAGNALFTLIGFCGVYAVLSALFVFLVGRRIARGPDAVPAAPPGPAAPAAGRA
jgi:cytochrome d ubiquinol oxidase subunit I